jgi:hypothetical protein
MGWSDRVADLAKAVTKHYEELVTLKTRFDDLREHTNDLLKEFKAALERLSDRMIVMEKEHAAERATLQASIQALTDRLNMLSEQALHNAVKDVARDIVLEAVRGSEGGKKPHIAGIESPPLSPGQEVKTQPRSG